MPNFGDTVQDEVTGFQGMVLAKLTGLYEATQVRVHPMVLTCSEGDIRTSVWLEESRVKVVKQAKCTAGFGAVRGRA
jgi:hypothetical protein